MGLSKFVYQQNITVEKLEAYRKDLDMAERGLVILAKGLDIASAGHCSVFQERFNYITRKIHEAMAVVINLRKEIDKSEEDILESSKTEGRC